MRIVPRDLLHLQQQRHAPRPSDAVRNGAFAPGVARLSQDRRRVVVVVQGDGLESAGGGRGCWRLVGRECGGGPLHAVCGEAAVGEDAGGDAGCVAGGAGGWGGGRARGVGGEGEGGATWGWSWGSWLSVRAVDGRGRGRAVVLGGAAGIGGAVSYPVGDWDASVIVVVAVYFRDGQRDEGVAAAATTRRPCREGRGR